MQVVAWCVLVLLALCGPTLVSLMELLEDLKSLKKVCHPLGLCNYTGMREIHKNDKEPMEMDAGTFKYRICFCDKNCHLFNDCCPDESLKLPSNATRILDIPSQYWSCQRMPLQHINYQNIYMVTSCPEGHVLGPQCSRTVAPENYDYKLDVPMLNNETGNWFQNIFCAICHNQESSLKSLQLSFVCSGQNATVPNVLESGEYKQGTLTWQWAENTCHLNMTMEEDEDEWVRPCVLTKQDCSPDWENETVAALCQQYALYQLYSNKGHRTVFKNPHCVICNNLNIKKVFCLKDNTVRATKPPKPQSLRIVMDFNWDVNHVSCGPKAVWDVLHEHCQPLHLACGEGMQYSSGHCTSLVTSNDALGPTLKTSCTSTVLELSDFQILPNGSLQLTLNNSNFFGMIFAAGDYGILLDGRAEVCDDAFAANLMDSDSVQGYLTLVCLSLSVICLTLHIIIHWLLPKLHNLPGRNLHALSWALMLAQLLFLTAVKPSEPVTHEFCVVIAVTLHFCYLAALCWMNVMSVDIWRTFSAATTCSNNQNLHLKYALFAWGAPAVVVTLAIVADNTKILPNNMQPNYAAGDTCWFGSPIGLGIFHGIPVSLILVVNLVLFAFTVYKLYHKQESGRYIKKKTKAELDQAILRHESMGAGPRPISMVPSGMTGPRDQVRFYLYLKLFIIMGLTWVMGTIAPLVPELWYPFVVLNGLQGTFIFIMFDLKRSVLVMLWQRLLGRRPLPDLLNSRCIKEKNDISLRNSSSRTSRATTSSRLSTSVTSEQVRLRITSDTELPVKTTAAGIGNTFSEDDEVAEDVALQPDWHNGAQSYSNCKEGTDSRFENT